MQWMGIINITPDSFSDGSLYLAPEQALDQALSLARAGATWLDFGAESTRPGSSRVDWRIQWSRLHPVLKQVTARLQHEGLGHVKLSVDTTSQEVISRALELDENAVQMVNDISAGEEGGKALFDWVAQRGISLCLMHKQGDPHSMQQSPSYKDVVAEVRDYLLERAQLAENAGVAKENIVIDPGIGFGKDLTHNVDLMRGLGKLVDTGYQVLLGASRKRWIQGIDPNAEHPSQREAGSIVSSLMAYQQGVAICRVHDVFAHAQALRVWQSFHCE